MKSKKKFLLLGVGTMGVLALGVGATSTLAWFQATVQGKVATTADKGLITVGEPIIGTDAIDMPIKVAVSNNLSTNKLALASWLTAAPSAPNSIKNGETFEDPAFYTAVAKTSLASGGFMYTANPGSGFVLSTVYTITITVPANHLDADGNETNVSPIYAYKNGSELYTHDEVVGALSSRYVDIKLERRDGYTLTADKTFADAKTYFKIVEGAYVQAVKNTDYTVGANVTADTFYEAVSSRAKFFSFGTSSSPTNKNGLTSINTKTAETDGYNSSGYALTNIGTGVNLYFGLYVDGENGETIDKMNPIGDFNITIVDHDSSFPA